MFAADQVLTGAFLSQSLDDLRRQITDNYQVDEDAYLRRLIPLATLGDAEEAEARARALRWIHTLRREAPQGMGIEPLLQEYRLDTREGLVLMSMAEALLRIPDGDTADRFIEDRLLSADWQRHLHADSALWLNTSTWALARTQALLRQSDRALIPALFKRLGGPVMRQLLKEAMALMGNRFILGETLLEALDRAQGVFGRGDSCSFDMLGEAALCRDDAAAYARAYGDAIDTLGKNESYPEGCLRPSISIKLSALHPRFEANQPGCLPALEATLGGLIERARAQAIAITLDAEEADRLEPTLALFHRLYAGPARGWGQLGLAVQAYSKRALPTLCWLVRLAEGGGDPIPVRLVKGAYWDAEIKQAQQRGLADYPVFTRKAATDLSFLACARLLFSGPARGRLYPQLASHNALSLSLLLAMADDRPFEFQRLQGMGEPLYRQLRRDSARPCRLYAPVGPHRHLLPYLVRRLLENGANSSFVNQIQNPGIAPDTLCTAPRQALAGEPALPRPPALFAPGRRNSRGLNLQIESQRRGLTAALAAQGGRFYRAAPLIEGAPRLDAAPTPCYAPGDRGQRLGELHPADADQAREALEVVAEHQPAWAEQPVEVRAGVLEAWAEALEQRGAELIGLLCREGGKTLGDAVDELREAVDFCRYYAGEARRLHRPAPLAAITGERNALRWEPRGLFLCISPWNFPLAIFTGQVAAALVAGNGVIAKPAHQCGLIAYRACELLLEAGLPAGVLALLPGPSAATGEPLLASPAVAGVAFTGSTATAQALNRRLAAREGCPLPTLIAETGGQNAMLVDSTALPEQVVRDAQLSAFGSAGQRCSALRVLYLQEEIAGEVERLLAGALALLRVGPTLQLDSDVGPVIDAVARGELQAHIEACRRAGRLIHQAPLPDGLPDGYYVAPTLVRVAGIEALEREHFGPVLHLARYRCDQLEAVIGAINRCGYGLTLGIQSRNEHWAESVARRIRVGNVYINRNQIGAVVGCQPFGGMGLSGTGPKAGGPHYLQRFMTEKVITTNTTAWGGNAALLSRAIDGGER